MWLHFERKLKFFTIAYPRWLGSRHSNCKPYYSHSCTYHFGHTDLLTIPPICYLYCLRAFGLAIPSVWKALIPDISMTLSFFIRSLLSTFSARLSLTIYMKCILNLPPFIFVSIYSAYFLLQLLSLTVYYMIHLFACLLSASSTRMWKRLSLWPNCCQAPLNPIGPNLWTCPQ